MEIVNELTISVTIITKADEIEQIRKANEDPTQSIGSLEKLKLVLGSDESEKVISDTLNDIIKELLDADDTHVSDLKRFIVPANHE